MTTSILNIGDRVTSKKTGLPMTGTVVGLLQGHVYYSVYAKTQASNYWDSLYPGYLDKNIVVVEFDTPQRAISKEEFGFHSGYISKELDTQYLLQVRFTQYAYYPEDDLEKI